MVVGEGWRGDLERWLEPFLAGLSHPARRRMCLSEADWLVGGLSRRVTTLNGAVTANLMKTEAGHVRTLAGQVSGLQIGFHKFNRVLLWIVFSLFAASVGYFTYCTVWHMLVHCDPVGSSIRHRIVIGRNSTRAIDLLHQ